MSQWSFQYTYSCADGIGNRYFAVNCLFLQTPFCCAVFGFAETERVADESGFQESIDVTLIKGPAGYRSRNLVGRFTVSAVSTNASMSISIART